MSLVNEILEELDSPDEVSFDIEIKDQLISEEFRSTFPIGRAIILITTMIALDGLRTSRSIREVIPLIIRILQLTYPKLISNLVSLEKSLLFRRNVIDSAIVGEILSLIEANPDDDKSFKLSKNGKQYLKMESKSNQDIGVLIRKLAYNKKVAKATIEI